MCLYPRVIKNRKYTKTKKNGGNIPAVKDERTKYVPVGCGRCIECRKQKAREWQVRLQEDIKQYTNGKFITLTFSNESILELTQEIEKKCMEEKTQMPIGYELDNEIATLGVRRFLERWRKEYTKSIRHWLITELGHNGTENIHLHGIIWTNASLNEVEKHWKYGWIWKGKKIINKATGQTELQNFVSAKTVNYIVKYVTKVDLDHKMYKSIILTSPGIGRGYMERTDYKNNTYKPEGNTNEAYRLQTGHKTALPIYYRNKIYSEEERELLWLEKLDRMIRYVAGQKIDVSKNHDDYYKLLELERKRNKQLGYGTDEKDWNREVYERERRIIMQKTRIANARAKGQHTP